MIPVRFPNDRERLEMEALELRRASPDERFEILVDLIAVSDSLLTASPRRRRQIELLEENEELEHRTWRALIRGQHGQGEAGG